MIDNEIIFWMCWFAGWVVITFGVTGLIFFVLKALMRDVITVKDYIKFRRKAELYDQIKEDSNE